MNDYATLIEGAPLVEQVEIVTTTGDLNYDGTALEIASLDGDELFHVVIDRFGKPQFLFFRSEGNYRVPLEEVERVLTFAKENVRSTR